MKPKGRLTLAFLLIAFACVGIFTFAISKSSQFNTAVKPMLTQQIIAQKLRHEPRRAKVAAPIGQKSPPPASKDPRVTPAAPLPNTGTGNVLAIFLVASTSGTLLAYVRKLKRLHRQGMVTAYSDAFLQKEGEPIGPPPTG